MLPDFIGTAEYEYYTYFHGIETVQAGSFNGMAIPLVEWDAEDVPIYESVNLGAEDTGWYVLKLDAWPATRMGNPYFNHETLGRVSIYEGLLAYNWDLGGHTGVGLQISNPELYAHLDYNKIPKSVFIDEWNEELNLNVINLERIGAEEPIGSPDPDTNPPEPRKANINIKPKLYWGLEWHEATEEEDYESWIFSQFISVTVSPAEDLENSNPVWYKPLIKTTGNDTPPVQNYGTSPSCIIGGDGVNVIGIEDFYTIDDTDWVLSYRFIYSGTPSWNTEHTHWTFSVNNHYYDNVNLQIAHAGDKLYINSFFGKVLQTITSASTHSISIACTVQPTTKSNIKIWYVSGYTEENWKDENAYHWTIGGITKDNVDNEGDGSEYFEIELPDEWPMEMFLRVNNMSIEGYLEDLAV